MIKFCGKSVAFSRETVISVIIGERSFPSWLEKNSDTVLVHKEENTNLIKNYQPMVFFDFY